MGTKQEQKLRHKRLVNERAPISVVIPTLDAAGELPATLAALAPAAIGGLVREVIISDGGSSDETREVADAAGATIVGGAQGRGAQLSLGAAAARGDWLLFLHADTMLGENWIADARVFIMQDADRAAVFTLRFAAKGLAPRLVAAGAMLRTRLFSSPYGDQGLLISRMLYDEIGGYRALPLFEDVDLIDRLVRTKGRRALTVLRATATTSAARYERGWFRRVLQNARCLALYRAGVEPAEIAKVYR